MAAARTCPECGAELTPGVLDGLCPKCMGKVTFGLDSKGEPVTSPTGSETASAPAEPEGTSPTVPASTPVSEQVGDRIGRYKLLQNLGQGGMGSVWMAEQTEPVRRLVALKVIKPGMDSAEVLARFEAERNTQRCIPWRAAVSSQFCSYSIAASSHGLPMTPVRRKVAPAARSSSMAFPPLGALLRPEIRASSPTFSSWLDFALRLNLHNVGQKIRNTWVSILRRLL